LLGVRDMDYADYQPLVKKRQAEMTVSIGEIAGIIRKVAPENTAAEWDNVGLFCGDEEERVDTVVLALDVREETLALAVASEAGLILSHHPLVFSPLKRIDVRTHPGKEIALLLENRIALYTAHTNLDSSQILSVNASIGRRLPLRDFGPVAAPIQTAGMKLVTFVPVDSADRLRESLAEAGAGVIGEYSHCSFSLPGTGTFLGSEEAKPVVGQKGNLERVEEIRLEMLCPKDRLDRILSALWASHPYEEVAYDLYPLAGYRSDTHYLWMGELESERPLSVFASEVKHALGEGVAPVKFAGDPQRPIRRVAWCSGSGKGLVSHVAHLGVDAYLTGDMGHHDALSCLSQGLAVVDLDHYYTEKLFAEVMEEYLSQELGEGEVTFLPDRAGPVFHAA